MTTPVFVYCAVGGHGGPVQSILTARQDLSRYRYEWFAGAWSQQMRERASGTDHGGSRVIDIARPRGMGTGLALAQLAHILGSLRDERLVVHANGLTEISLLLPVLRVFRFPVVVWVHNYEIPRKARILKVARSLLPEWLQVAAVSAYAAKKVRTLLGEDTDVTVVPNPISSSDGALRRTPNGRLRVAYLGTDRHYKGFDYLVKTIERSAGEFQWVIASHPFATDRAGWQRLVRSKGNDVKIVGRVADAARIYAECDVVFVPSRQESFCRVAAEGLANGTFVVASDLEPLREFTALGDTLSLFPVGDVDEAVSRLRAVGSVSVDQRVERGAQTARRAREAFSPGSVAHALELLYDRALAASSRRTSV